MAEIAPIRGILYDPTRVSPSMVLAPPYDVIDDDQRAALEARDPHNSVRLILPRGEGEQKYATAAGLLRRWREEKLLVRDELPAIYRYNQTYTSAELGPAPVTRRGFISAVRLHRFDEDVIKPHERTLSGPKEDRLKLMRAASCHFSQIFMLYPDPRRAVDTLVAPYEAQAPDLDGTTTDGTRHRLWRITDLAVQQQIAALLGPLPFYIADGHHRYETMLALRDEHRRKDGGQSHAYATTEFATAFLANMDDPGLVVLPTHRLVHGLAGVDAEMLRQKAGEHFTVEHLPGLGRPGRSLVLRSALADRAALAPSFALVVPRCHDAWVFSLKVAPSATGLPGAPPLVVLDVSLLHGLIFERVLGISRVAQEAQTNITYVKDTRDALERMQAADSEEQLGFIMHPTRVAQVQAVADAREVMPQKSTFFYPKLASGLVVNPLDPSEILPRLA
jgi:uncharacterized protein (DUF1015 family)